MSFISAIAPQAWEFDIVMFVLPEMCHMPFITNTEVSENFYLLIYHRGSKRGEEGAHWTLFLEIQVHNMAAAPLIQSRLRPMPRLTS